MPPKYHIETHHVPNRMPPISRSGVVAWEEGCLRCLSCVKKQCVYKVYETRRLDPGQMRESLDFACKGCFRCVQNCPRGLIHKTLDPKFLALGDHYWTGEIISKLWFQAETGRVPVSGAGYGGAFSGPGFDSMWTDMSEIVRPTRDGIHGREYISTSVDLGRKPMALYFGPQGELLSAAPALKEIPVPVILDRFPWCPASKGIPKAVLAAARALGTLAATGPGLWDKEMEPYKEAALWSLAQDSEELPWWLAHGLHVVELQEGPDVMEKLVRLKDFNPEIIVMIRLELYRESGSRALELARGGVEILHLKADPWGKEHGEAPRFILQAVREIHFHLVEAGIRDALTLVAGGGVAMAEHMCKLIIAGADAVSVDVPLLVAMECRVCRRCLEGLPCPAGLEDVDPRWGAARIKNLLAAWHSQLLEVMGAMGMRDVRRLRGEMGRAMFFEDLEREFFSCLGRRA